MKEFGSDFHLVIEYQSKCLHLTDIFPNALLMSDGRQCIVALIRQHGWKRIWMPEYFCYEVIETIKQQTNIEIVFYLDLPTGDDQAEVECLAFEEGDVLLRINYFGLRGFRSNANIPVPVIEDHTHDLLGHWALHSDAEWCIASVRKTLPLPEGGMLWSPKGLSLQHGFEVTSENEDIANTRWEGMHLKAAYLRGETTDKEEFRCKFLDTEEWFNNAEISAIDEKSRVFLENFDINTWLGAKLRNWKLLCKLVNVENLMPENESCTPFSFIIFTNNFEERERLRHCLIERSVYPAVLWNVPDTVSKDTQDFSQRMLSIHCDGRYTEEDICQLAAIINE